MLVIALQRMALVKTTAVRPVSEVALCRSDCMYGVTAVRTRILVNGKVK
jgi:hypothetical protein